MPDRTMVDDDETIWNVRVAAFAASDAEAKSLVYHTVKHPLANEDGVALVDITLDTPQPRALVALSEDRQWLVVHRPRERKFFVYEEFHFDSGQACYGEYWETNDTGQSAEDVLASWLEGRNDRR